MKKPLLLFTIAFTILTNGSFAQKNYKPATIITTEGDSLSGEIDYKNWKRNPSKILFKKDQSSEPVTYSPHAISGFTVSGDVYKSAIVEVDERMDNLAHLSDNNVIITHQDTVFIRTIMTGVKPLYLYHDDVDHFYIAKDNAFQLLRYKKYSDEARMLNQARIVRTNKEYVLQLEQYLTGCASGNKFAKMNYDLSSLRKVFLSYYDCVAATPDYIEKKENEKFEIGILAGVSNTIFSVNSQQNNVISRVDYPSSMNFTGGVFFDLVFPRQRGKVSLNNEILYSTFNTKGTYRVSTSDTRYDEHTYEFGYSYLKLNTMLRYKFFLNSAIIFVNGGISNGGLLKEVNTLTKYHKFDSYESTTIEKGFADTRKHELGFLLGAGVRKNRASIELRGERSNGAFTSPYSQANVMRYFALVSYRLK